MVDIEERTPDRKAIRVHCPSCSNSRLFDLTGDCSESSGSNVPDAEKRWRYSWHIAMNSNTEGRSFITEHIRDKENHIKTE